MEANFLTDSLAEALVRSIEFNHPARSTAGGQLLPPFNIAISREPGARGPSVARALGQRLGWSVYDQQLLEDVARDMGARADLLALVDEKSMSWLEQVMVDTIADSHLNPDSYVVHLLATLRVLAAHGNCVIVGRGATFALPARTTLRVRLVGDLKDRIANMQRVLHISEKEAAHWVEKTHQERHDFVRRYFGKNADDPRLYDLVLNTSRLSVEDCAEVISVALHLQASQPAPQRSAS